MATTTHISTLSEISSDWIRNFSVARKEPSWLLDLRLKAFEQYNLLPWPTGRDEKWKRSELNLLSFDQLQFKGGTLPLKVKLTDEGVETLSLEEAIANKPDLIHSAWETAVSRAQANKFLSLTLALGNGGSVIVLPKNKKINTPVQRFGLAGNIGEALFALHFLILEEGSEAQLWEELNGESLTEEKTPGVGFLSSFTSIHLKANSHSSFYSMQNWNGSTVHFQFQDITQEKDSHMNTVAVGLGGRVFRNESVIRLRGDGAENKVLGVLFGDQNQNFENWITQNHTARKTISDIQYRGALKGQARSFFSGMVSITKEAQQSDAFQSSKSLLLSKGARADAIPNLEILADDVKCSHGAAMGPIDEEQKFYLETRGIPPDQAERIIVQGFFESVIREVPSEVTQEKLRSFVEEKLDRK